MVDPKVIAKQLKDINFGSSPWNKAEVNELHRIIHEGEVISECVNGMYEGGVALLIATELRVLLVDKKPLRYLNVEDFRFDMINEIDFSHRLTSASITISTGGKTLKFKSYNQPRLRHLINLVQQHMSNGKMDQAQTAETQQQHLQEINKQLQTFLMAQHHQLQQQIQANTADNAAATMLPKPDPQLSDYLFAQRIMEQLNNGTMPTTTAPQIAPPQVSQSFATAVPTNVTQTTAPVAQATPAQPPMPQPAPISSQELADAARREVFGKNVTTAPPQHSSQPNHDNPANFFTGIEVNPVKVAYSKLPMMLRNRKFGRPSLHAHSHEVTPPTGRPVAAI